jgi:hypothetical protein
MAKLVKRSTETTAGKKRAAAKKKPKQVVVVARTTIYVGEDENGKGVWAKPGDHFTTNENRAKFFIGNGHCMTPAQEAAGMSIHKNQMESEEEKALLMAEAAKQLEEFKEEAASET